MQNLGLTSPTHSQIHDPEESHVPFNFHINQTHGSRTLRSKSKFHFFLQLPIELQLCILEDYCDHQTLFRLMHTSTQMRAVAKHVFWSHPDVWYYASAQEVMRPLMKRHRPSHSFHRDPVFTSQIQQVELFMDRGTWCWPSRIATPSELKRFARSWPDYLVKENVEKFILEFLRLYPNVRRVVLTDESGELWERISEGWKVECAALATLFPAHINVFLSDKQSGTWDNYPDCFSCTRTLFRIDSPAKTLVMVTTTWSKQRLVPPRLPVKGIVGAFLQTGTPRRKEITSRRRALAILRLEAIERHYFDRNHPVPILCPHPECEQKFEQIGAFSSHVATNLDHDGWKRRLCRKKPKFLSLLPERVESLFSQAGREVLDMQQQYQDNLDQVREAWGQPSSVERIEYYEEFMEQLHTDPDLRNPQLINLDEHELWRRLRRVQDKYWEIEKDDDSDATAYTESEISEDSVSDGDGSEESDDEDSDTSMEMSSVPFTD
ncbi:hypothetical protein BT63DRAFT_78443 [Microthyrium microscopicum]|uniref:F-box domain-containing protein n=1 Tax=Microthyrium microscopicum TaxID=703497 RepID=A0A6A6TXR6_9PEZI|nr:hypothetical protein BT63DRAFT_78443 [Microthyrium microscopicum]